MRPISELGGSTTVLVAAPDGAWPTPRSRTAGVGGQARSGVVARLIESAGECGAVQVTVQAGCIVAEFVGVTPAARALYRWVAELCADAAAGGLTGDLGGARLVSATGGSLGTPAGAGVHDHWSSLLATAGPGEIVVDATMAVLAGQLASGVAELTYRGAHSDQYGGIERSYRLRCLLTGVAAATRPANLGWARRTPASQAGPVDDAVGMSLDRWERCLAGQSSCLLVSTSVAATDDAIAAEVALTLHARGAAVLHGRWESHADGGCAALDRAVDDCRAALSARWPTAWSVGGGCTRRGRHDSPSPVPARRSGSAATTAASLLTSVTIEWPVVLVLERLDWHDEDTVATLGSLRRRTTAQRLLVVVTAGTDAIGDMPADVRELFNVVIGDPAVLATRQPALVGAVRNAQRDG